MKTIIELENFLKTNHSNLNYFLIGNVGKYGMDGFGLEKFGSLFVWFYYEREGKQNLEYFNSEEKAVNFALKEIQKYISNL